MPTLIFTYAIVVYVFFLAVFLYTMGFVANLAWLPKTLDSGTPGDLRVAVAVDVLLLGIFAIQHSVMARQGFKRWWTRIIAPAAERSSYVLAATLAVALMVWQWQPLPTTVWSVRSPALMGFLQGLSACGWLTLLAATFMINHFELFGLQQGFAHWRGVTPAPIEFRTPGLYRMVRHPIYLGFILAFWATPQMSQGHLLFAIATTAYIFIGVWFEERDLVARFGERYRAYRRQVPMIVPMPGQAGRANETSPPRRV